MAHTSITMRAPQSTLAEIGARFDAVMPVLMRISMVVVMLWFGFLKFTTYEANAIQGLVSNSPLVSWLNTVLSVAGVSALIGTVEVATGLLIAARFFSAKLGAIGGAMAAATFFITLSFFFSTPGVAEAEAGGFPIISVLPGQFLLKDLVLLVVSLWILADGLKHWNE
jgi:reactive chlorine resistance protein C